MNEELYEKALKAINELFNDDSVNAQIALDNMTSLRDEIETFIDALETDIDNED